MPYHEGMTQQEYDADMGAARREGKTDGHKAALEDFDGLTPKQVRDLKAQAEKAQADLTAAQAATEAEKTKRTELEGQITAREKADKVRAALKSAGFREDRVDKLLRDVPDDIDITDEAKAKPVIDKLKADYPEWVGKAALASSTTTTPAPAAPNGVKTSPTEPGAAPAKPSLTSALTDLVTPKN